MDGLLHCICFCQLLQVDGTEQVGEVWGRKETWVNVESEKGNTSVSAKLQGRALTDFILLEARGFQLPLKQRHVLPGGPDQHHRLQEAGNAVVCCSQACV